MEEAKQRLSEFIQAAYIFNATIDQMKEAVKGNHIGESNIFIIERNMKSMLKDLDLFSDILG